MNRAEELRVHALGAAISRRSWGEVEAAHAAIRDAPHFERCDALSNLQDAFMAALRDIAGPDARIEGKGREVRLERGDGMVCIPTPLFIGVDPATAPAIARSYVEAFDAGRRTA